MKKIFFLSLFLFFIPTLCFASDYYISSSGSGGDGSKGNPWGPSEIPWTNFESGSENVYLYFFGGTYTSTLSIRHNYTGNRVYIKPGSASPSPSGINSQIVFSRTGGYNIFLYSGSPVAHNVTIDGETTSGSGTGNIKLVPGDGPAIETNSSVSTVGVVLRYLEITGMDDDESRPQTCGYNITPSNYAISFRNMETGTEIAYCYFHHNWGHSDILITTASNAYGIAKVHHNTIETGTVNYITGGSGVDIYNNYFDASTAYCPYDIIHNYSASGIQYVRIYNNYFKSSDQMLFLENKPQPLTTSRATQNVRIYNNVFEGVVLYPVPVPMLIHTMNATLDDIIIANNTFINGRHGIIMECYSGYTARIGGTTPVKIVNNIFKDGSAVEMGGAWIWDDESDFVFDYNLMYPTGYWEWHNAPGGTEKTYTSLTTWNNDHPTLNHNPTFTDPLFISTTDFHLQSSSPAIDHGATLSSFFTTDLEGTTRPVGVAWDIGAYEYVSGADDTIPPAAPTGLAVT